MENLLETIPALDFIIVSTRTLSQEQVWQDHLSKALRDSCVVCVTECWPGGAGNGLGTLHAYQMAKKKIQEIHSIDLYERQLEGASVAIIHAAGEGKRLAPLSLSEQNNKSGIKLPAFTKAGGYSELMTLLEGVIKQVSSLGSLLKGRVGVFWSDQIFMPPRPHHLKAEHPIEIFSIPISFPSQTDWLSQNLSSYGILARHSTGSVKHLDKINFETLSELKSLGIISSEISISLGSFILSHQMIKDLLEEFSEELCHRKGKMDSDCHFWMPLTLDRDTYLRLMGQRLISLSAAQEHYSRMQRFVKKISVSYSTPLFGLLDMGKNCYWWDFGTVSSYIRNNLKIISNGEEARFLKHFFSIPSKRDPVSFETDENSIIINCHIGSGKVRNSILIGVTADSVDVSESLVLNSKIKSLHADESLIYQVISTNDLLCARGDVLTDVFLPNKEKSLCLHTSIDNDGKEDWNKVIPPNPLSYEEISLLFN